MPPSIFIAIMASNPNWCQQTLLRAAPGLYDNKLALAGLVPLATVGLLLLLSSCVTSALVRDDPSGFGQEPHTRAFDSHVNVKRL